MSTKRWEEYKYFFQITILRYLVLWFSLVPVIAGVVYQFPNPLILINGNKSYEIELSLPFTWQLLWLSSLFFVIALSIYKYRCPKFIHKYNTFSDYKAYSHDQRWMAWEASYLIKEADESLMNKLVDRLNTKKYLIEVNEVGIFSYEEPQVKELQTIYYFTHKGKNYGLGMPVYINDKVIADAEKGVFYELFGRYSESKKNSRIIIQVLLILSLCLFIVVLGQHIIAGGLLFVEWVKETFF